MYTDPNVTPDIITRPADADFIHIRPHADVWGHSENIHIPRTILRYAPLAEEAEKQEVSGYVRPAGEKNPTGQKYRVLPATGKEQASTGYGMSVRTVTGPAVISVMKENRADGTKRNLVPAADAREEKRFWTEYPVRYVTAGGQPVR